MTRVCRARTGAEALASAQIPRDTGQVAETTMRRVGWRLPDPIRTLAREIGPAAGLGLPGLMRHPVWARADDGAGVGVVVVPGFGGADPSMAVLRQWLDRRGYRPTGAGLGFNLGCTAELVDRLERRVEAHAAETGGPVLVVGHSRGGWLGRMVAVRRPELVRGLAMLGSPVLDPLDTRGVATVSLRLLLRVSALGLRGLLTDDCVNGACRDLTAGVLAAPLTVPAVAVYSRMDGVVGWMSCRDPAAEWVEVTSSHGGMGTDPLLYAAIAPRLASWAGTPVPITGAHLPPSRG